MYTPRDGRSRVLSDRKVLFHRGFRGDETGVSGDDGHFFYLLLPVLCVFGKNFQREKGESRCRRFDAHRREREREREYRAKASTVRSLAKERENREKLEEEEEEGKEREKKSAHLNCRVCVLKQCDLI